MISFINVGCNNWKKARERFREHEMCHLHNEALMKLKSLNSLYVAVRLSTQLVNDLKYRREMLMEELTSIKYLTRQGLAFRGHNDEEGNFIQLLKSRADDVYGLNSWIRGGHYLSHDIVNEFLDIMVHQILRGLLHNIREAEWFSLIADETRDISGIEQISIFLR